MSHPLETVINEAEGFVLIGDSTAERFPALSYHAYTEAGKRFYCLDLGGLTESRGFTKGGKVYTSVEELPEDRGDLAILWVTRKRAAEAVDVAHEAGCTRVWFSFKTAHADALERAKAHGMEIVEVGRCPVYYLKDKGMICRLHSLGVKLTGVRGEPPRTTIDRDAREML